MLRTKLYEKEMILVFLLWIHSYVAIFEQNLHMEYISLLWLISWFL